MFSLFWMSYAAFCGSIAHIVLEEQYAKKLSVKRNVKNLFERRANFDKFMVYFTLKKTTRSSSHLILGISFFKREIVRSGQVWDDVKSDYKEKTSKTDGKFPLLSDKLDVNCGLRHNKPPSFNPPNQYKAQKVYQLLFCSRINFSTITLPPKIAIFQLSMLWWVHSVVSVDCIFREIVSHLLIFVT